jgi:hypothetical protein
MLDKICEPQFVQYLQKSIGAISARGMDIEMANLTVKQPKIDLLSVELTHGLPLQRNQRLP